MKSKDNLIDDCKKYLGLSPYNTWTNIDYADPHVYVYMCNKYGEQNVVDTIKALREQ